MASAIYLCKSCNQECTKPALVSSAGSGKETVSTSGLGTWNCRKCGGKTKVVAHYKKETE